MEHGRFFAASPRCLSILLSTLVMIGSLEPHATAVGDNSSSSAVTGGIRVVQYEAATPGGVFLFPRTPDQKIRLTIAGSEEAPRSLQYQCTVVGYDDQARFHSKGDLSLSPSAPAQLSLTFDPSKWPLGPYEARLDLISGGKLILTHTMHMGIITSTPLQKARQGEFLYGLDPANNDIYPTHTPVAFAYYRLMGVDLLRNLYEKRAPRTVEYVGQSLRELEGEGLLGMIMCDPPKSPDPEKRAAELKKKAAYLEELAQYYAGRGPGKLTYFELGNEPDLPHFYPLPIEEYLAPMVTMYGAIKKGADGKETVVMNGGLSFAGMEGDRRSREFLRLVDAAKLDAIAYHGHGLGIEAERSAFERVREAAAQGGKTALPFIQTESGYSGHNRQGLLNQARTVVEKMTYAQSQGIPLFIFFRLFMEGSGIEGGYGMTHDFVEPFPSVLAYRNLVERLRHFRFVKSLDFAAKAGAEGVVAYLFEERDEAGNLTGRNAMITFCDEGRSYDLRLQLAEPGKEIKEAATYDLFGNSAPARVMSNMASFTTGPLPVYLTWTAEGGPDAIQVAPPVISAKSSESLLVGASGRIALTVNNPLEHLLEAEVKADLHGVIRANVTPATQKITLQPGQPMEVSFQVEVEKKNFPLNLPRWWKVFTDIDESRFSLEDLKAIPKELPGRDRPIVGRYLETPEYNLNFAKVAGGFGKNRTGIAYAIVDSPADLEFECGASGDWWMAWFLNGEKVYDTLDKGNEAHGPITNHPFKLRLQRGRNILSVLVRSGNGGWGVVFGGPQELRAARGEPDCLVVTLNTKDEVITHHNIPLLVRQPVPPLGPMAFPERLDEWLPLEPMVVLGESHVVNNWMKEPDSTRWYKGEKDLSGKVWLREDGENLHFLAAITDDKPSPPAKTPDQLPSTDHLHLKIADDQGQTLLEILAGRVGETGAMLGAPAGVTCRVSLEQQDGEAPVTLYHLTIPLKRVGERPFRLSFSVADYDGPAFLKQKLQFRDVDLPLTGQRWIVVHP